MRERSAVEVASTQAAERRVGIMRMTWGREAMSVDQARDLGRHRGGWETEVMIGPRTMKEDRRRLIGEGESEVRVSDRASVCMHPSGLVMGELGMPFFGRLLIALIPLAILPSACVAIDYWPDIVASLNAGSHEV